VIALGNEGLNVAGLLPAIILVPAIGSRCSSRQRDQEIVDRWTLPRVPADHVGRLSTRKKMWPWGHLSKRDQSKPLHFGGVCVDGSDSASFNDFASRRRKRTQQNEARKSS
jgi:hypothetical protein